MNPPQHKYFLATDLTLWVQESPSTSVKELLRIIGDGLHDFAPVQTLHSFSVADITGTENKYLKNTFSHKTFWE